ncbi:MAG: ATP-dependent zinc metalloprotease FtsH [Anaerolineaceae bacterium]|nr:ATP-dependent zinc metalloprotease FtsH [Anaerolineaceae bacterium]
MQQNIPNVPESDSDDQPTRSIWRLLFWLLLILPLVVYYFFLSNGADADRITLDYSRFRQEVAAENVTAVTIEEFEVRGELAEAVTVPAADSAGEEATVTGNQFTTFIPAVGDDSLLPLLEQYDVRVTAVPPTDSTFWAILINVLPFLLLIGLGYFFISRMRQSGQQIFSMGESRAKLYDQEKEPITFADVAGLEGVKTELEEIVAYLKAPERVQRLGGQAPKGILLVGPPGTGKTLLARAVAGEANVPFYSITGSDFMEMFVGVGASRVRGLFDNARKTAPCIIFIDELDSIGRRRGAGLGGGHDEREQTLNQMLSEMDGFEPTENVVVIAATNRPDILDPALLRPGRFDRQITVNLPTLSARKDILQIHARGKPLAPGVDLNDLARGTPGFSGADLENVLNEAALLAARQEKDVIEQSDIEEARDKILMGLEREGLALTEKEREMIAYHEAGHAVIAAVLPHADPIHKVTIVPRGQAMGVTQQLPEREKYIYPREYMLDRLAVMMGGRAAENMQFQTATSGAENDLKQATELARRMVLDWGMSERFGFMALGGRSQQVFLGEEISRGRNYSETTAREVDEEVMSILDAAFQRAHDTLQTHKEGLTAVAATLLEKEEMLGEEVMKLLFNLPPEAQAAAV